MKSDFLIILISLILIGCNNNNKKSAEKLYQQAQSISSSYPILMNDDSILSSIKLLDKAIALDSTDVRFHLYKTNMYSNLDNIDSMFISAKRGWDICKSNYTLALITGVIFERKGDRENSRYYYNEALGRIKGTSKI